LVCNVVISYHFKGYNTYKYTYINPYTNIKQYGNVIIKKSLQLKQTFLENYDVNQNNNSTRNSFETINDNKDINTDNMLSKRNYNPFKKAVNKESTSEEKVVKPDDYTNKNYSPFKKLKDYLTPAISNKISNEESYINKKIDGVNNDSVLVSTNENPSTNELDIKTTSTIVNQTGSVKKLETISNRLLNQWSLSVQDMKKNPMTYVLIPICAAIIGYITNWVGVNMLFYPLKWTGIPILKIEGQPLGIIGWQGIVPAKRIAMASRIVDITISKLISIPEVFGQLKPKELAKLLSPTIMDAVPITSVPGISSILNLVLRKTSKSIIKNIENIVDIKTLVVSGLTKNPNVLVNLFQKVGHKELKFLIDSGFGFGFLLGILQMIQWMFLPYNWTLPVGGAIVGYVTNWIALKWIFEPLNPTKIGPFVFQGLFLRRQNEVSKDFSEYICSKVLTSPNVWQSMLEGPKSNNFVDIIKKYTVVPFLSNTVMAKLISDVGGSVTHPIHEYTEKQLNLKNILIQKMNQMTSVEFEQVLHPIFQEDEITLIVAGGVLGAISGLLQWYINVKGMELLKSWWKNMNNKNNKNNNEVLQR